MIEPRPHPSRKRTGRPLSLACTALMLLTGIACCSMSVGCARDPAQPVSDRQVMHVCPQHPDVRSPAPGLCPACGRDLIAEDKLSRPALVSRTASEATR